MRGTPAETCIDQIFICINQLRNAVELHGLVEDDIRAALQNVSAFRSSDRMTGFHTDTFSLARVIADAISKTSTSTTSDSQITGLMTQLHASASALSDAVNAASA